MSPLDLHVLGTPPAFVLSQDQTLVFNPSMSSPSLSLRFEHQNSSESSLSLFLSLRVSLSSVSFSRFGPLSLPWAFRPPARASLHRISNPGPFVNPFFEKIFDVFQVCSGSPYVGCSFLIYTHPVDFPRDYWYNTGEQSWEVYDAQERNPDAPGGESRSGF